VNNSQRECVIGTIQLITTSGVRTVIFQTQAQNITCTSYTKCSNCANWTWV